MDDNSVLTDSIDRKKFMEVWQRVNGGAGMENTETEAEALCAFIMAETEAVRGYTVLTGRLSGKAAECLAAIARDERRHMKKLQTRYFMLTGDTCSCPAAQPVCRTVLESLRRSYYSELKAAEGYRRAAAEASQEIGSIMFGELAKDEERHAEMIMTLIQRIVS